MPETLEILQNNLKSDDTHCFNQGSITTPCFNIKVFITPCISPFMILSHEIFSVHCETIHLRVSVNDKTVRIGRHMVAFADPLEHYFYESHPRYNVL